MSEIRKVGVVGAGLMGSGIAQVSAAAGYETIVREIATAPLEAGLAAIRRSLDRAVEKEKMTAEHMKLTLEKRACHKLDFQMNDYTTLERLDKDRLSLKHLKIGFQLLQKVYLPNSIKGHKGFPICRQLN